MGRKKRKQKGPIIFCYYCNKTYDNEKTLIQHQKAKHFKCPKCNRKNMTSLALKRHIKEHREVLEV